MGQLQFHCGTPPPAAVPSNRIRMEGNLCCTFCLDNREKPPAQSSLRMKTRILLLTSKVLPDWLNFKTRRSSSVCALACLLAPGMLFGQAAFNYAPLTDPILSANLSID